MKNTNIKDLIKKTASITGNLTAAEKKPKRAEAIRAACAVMSEDLLIEIFGKEAFFEAASELQKELEDLEEVQTENVYTGSIAGGTEMDHDLERVMGIVKNQMNRMIPGDTLQITIVKGED